MESAIPVAEERGECDLSVPIPRGGPIYVPNMLSSSTRVPDFLDSLVSELENLEVELLDDDASDIDISVDDLKVFTDDELMDMALKQVLPAEQNNHDQAILSDQSDSGRFRLKYSRRKKGGANNSNPQGGCIEKEEQFVRIKQKQEEDKKAVVLHSSKVPSKYAERKKKGANNSTLPVGYIEKVEQVVKIKQKQEEDKAAARLHSFNPVHRTIESSQKSATTERMRSLRSTSSTKKVNTIGLLEHIPVQYPEAVLTVEVYHNVRRGVKTQEFLVLGGQTLSALRDKIFCSMDQVMDKAGQHDPSGYFLIEDAFCTDLRDPSATDYTKPILDWLRNSKDEALKKWECIINGELQQRQKAVMGEAAASQLPNLTSIEMHKIRFCDLSFRLGAGYLYCHQGDCTHTIVIRDMRLIHPDDVLNRAAYPIITFQLKLRFQKCSVCKLFRATKVTVDDKWTPENPCYFCDECFALLHLAEDGSQLYTDFIEYDYNHD